jgi:hypothetical protein
MTGLLLAGAGTLPVRLLLLTSSTSAGSASQLAGMLPRKLLLPSATSDMLLLPAQFKKQGGHISSSCMRAFHSEQ